MQQAVPIEDEKFAIPAAASKSHSQPGIR